MRLTATLLSAVATIAIAAPAAAQQEVPGTAAEQQVPTSSTANAAVQSQSPNAGDPAISEADSTTAGDIVVTATRRASPLSDVPIAVSAVTQAQLQNSGANDIRQLNQLAPSLLVSSTGNEATYGNYDNYRFQGGLTGPLIGDVVAFRVDGVYNKRDGFLRNITQNNNEARVNDRDRYLVRGQLLFKTDDIALRLIGDYSRRDESCCGATYYSKFETFDPTPGTNTTAANGATVNTDGAIAYADSNRILGVLNRLGAVRPTTDQRANPFDRRVAISPGRTYQNITKDYGGSGQLDWDLGGANLTAITAYREFKSGNAADTDYGNVDFSYRDTDSFRQFKTFTQELRLQGSLFDGKLDWLVGGFYSHEKLRLVDSTRFGPQYGAFAACRLVATLNPNPAAFGALTPAIIAGLDRLSGTVTNGVRTGGVNDVGDTRSNYRQTSENYAFFTHNIINVTDQLSVTLGLRYTHENKKFTAALNNNNSVCPAQQAALSPLLASAAVPAAVKPFIGAIVTLTCTGNSTTALNALNLRDSFNDGEFTGTAVVAFKPTDRLMTYASFAKGYKAGGYNLDRSNLGTATRGNVFSSPTNADAPGLRFDAEKVDAYEIGAKYNISGKFNINVAAFRQEFKDFQLNTFNGSVFVVQNIQGCDNNLNGADIDNVQFNGTCVGDANRKGVISQGVEVEATVSPIRDVTFTAGYTYADTYFRRNLVGNSQGAALDPALFLLPGNQMSNAPKNVVTNSFTWTPAIGSSGLRGLVYVDSRTTSDYNTGSDLAPEKKQDGFSVVNARIGLRGKDQLWALELWAQNVFNKDYVQVAFNSPFQGAGSIANAQRFGGTSNALYSAFLAEPRTYGATLRSRF